MSSLVPINELASANLREDEHLQILDLARWAPSGDNCQPWRVRTSPLGWEIHAVGIESPAFLDVNLEATRVAMGAFVENVHLAAGRHDFGCETEYFANADDPVWARCRLYRDERIEADGLAAFIRDRASNRRLYQPGSCTGEDLKALRASISRFSDINLELCTSAEQLQTIAQAVALTDRVRMQHRQCHQEFHEKVRWSPEAARRDPTGFDVATFEIKRHEAWLLRMTRPYALLRLVDAVTGLSRIAASVAAKQVIHSGAVGMIFADQDDPFALMNVGRALQRLWLTATSRGLAFQVLGVAPLFMRRMESGAEGFTRSQASAVLSAREKLGAVISPNGSQGMPTLMFRVGRAMPPSARANRLPAGKLVVVAG